MSKKQKILFFVVLIFFLGQISPAIIFAKTTALGVKEVEVIKVKGIDLEVTYPEIFEKGPHPKAGLVNYIAYIYYFAVAIVGLLIFSILIYNGFKYLVSAGNVETLTGAKRGILGGFLGAFILLSAVLIFNLISPHLNILPPPLIGELAGFIPAGVYICNHKIPEIEGILNNYLSENKEIRKKAINDFIKTTYNRCWRVKSGETKIGKIKTMFTVPKREKESWDYNEAIVIINDPPLKYPTCEIFPRSQNSKIFRRDILHGAFPVTSIWRIKKQQGKGKVVLFEGIEYNEAEIESKGEIKLAEGIYELSEKEEVKKITKEDLKKAELWKEDIIMGDRNLVKSIASYPHSPPMFVVVMRGRTDGDNPICDIDENGVVTNLETRKSRIGRCGPLCWITVFTAPKKEKEDEKKEKEDEKKPGVGEKYCHSCFNELIIIKGTKD